MRNDPNGISLPDWKRYGYASYEAWISEKTGQSPSDQFNPDGELCAACGKPAKGYAYINDKRYCHGDEPGETCYESGNRSLVTSVEWPMPKPPPYEADDEGKAEPHE